MYTQWQSEPLRILFAGGLETKTDEKAIILGKLPELENAVFIEHGALIKRFGSDRVTDYRITAPQHLTTFKDELLLASNNKLYSYDSTELIEKGDFENVIITGDEVCEQPKNQYNCDTAATDTLRIYCWADGGGVYYSVQDILTGQWLVSAHNLSATGTVPRAVANNNTVLVLYAESGATNIDYVLVNNNSPQARTTGTLFSDMHADSLFSTGVFGAYYFVAYKSTASEDIKVARCIGSTVESSVDTGETAVDSTLLNLCLTEDYLVLVYTDSTGADILSATVTNVSSGTLIVSDTETLLNGTAIKQLAPTIVTNTDDMTDDVILFYNESDDVYTLQFRTDLTEIETDVGILASYIASQAFTVDNIAYCILGHETALELQNAYYIARAVQYNGTGSDVDMLRLVGQFNLQNTPSDDGVTNHLPSVYDGKLTLEYRNRYKLPTDPSTNQQQIVFSETGLKLFTLEFGSSEYNSVEANDGLYFSGSLLWLYDGVNLGEANPLMYPEPEIVVNATTHPGFVILNPTGSMANGTYGYKIAYERRTHQGEVVRSHPIEFSVETSGISGQVQITIPTLRHTNYDDWYIVIWRTTNAGSTYYRVSDVNPENNTGANRWVDNDRTADSVTFLDSLADASITTNDIFPPSVIQNLPVPASKFIARSKQRLFLGGGEINSNRVYYSKLRSDSTAVEFNDQFYIDVDEIGGDITAIGTMRDVPLIFKEHKIYYVTGVGPSNLGIGDYSEPEAIPTDSGCANANTLVEMPYGVMYKSTRGIYRVNLNFQVEYAGADVEGFNDLNTTSALLLPDENAALFFSSDGKALYYDYNFSQWSSFTNHLSFGATLWKDTYAYVQPTGDILIQNKTKYRDGNVPYAFRAKTGPITPLGSLQGWFRSKLTMIMGEYITPHNLTVNVYENRNAYPVQSETFEPSDFIDTSTWGDDATWGASEYWGGGETDYQIELYHHPQKFQSFALEFIEIPDTVDSGQAFQLTELAVFWAPLGGPGRNSTARRK